MSNITPFINNDIRKRITQNDITIEKDGIPVLVQELYHDKESNYIFMRLYDESIALTPMKSEYLLYKETLNFRLSSEIVNLWALDSNSQTDFVINIIGG